MPSYGFVAIVLLFAVVWTTDILAYFVGRLVGGPKLWTRVSPKKTWSGAIGGLAGAIVAALAVAHYAQLGEFARRRGAWPWYCPSRRRPATCSNRRSSAGSGSRTRAMSSPDTAA